MRTAITALAVLAFGGCASAATPKTGTAITHVAIDDLPQEPAHGPELPHQPVPIGEPKDAVAAAINLVVEGLHEQGLVVLDISAQPLDTRSDSATVRIAATHASHTGALHTSLYEVHLVRDSLDRWVSSDFPQLQ